MCGCGGGMLQVYNLVLHPDVHTAGHVQWFFFRVGNVLPGVRYRFTLGNFTKRTSQFSRGQQPVMFSLLRNTLRVRRHRQQQQQQQQQQREENNKEGGEEEEDSDDDDDHHHHHHHNDDDDDDTDAERADDGGHEKSRRPQPRSPGAVAGWDTSRMPAECWTHVGEEISYARVSEFLIDVVSEWVSE